MPSSSLPVSSDSSSSPSGYVSHRYADEYWEETVLARHQVSQSISNKSDLTSITTHLFHSKSNNQTVSYAITYSAAGHTQGSILNLSILRYLHVLRRLEMSQQESCLSLINFKMPIFQDVQPASVLLCMVEFKTFLVDFVSFKRKIHRVKTLCFWDANTA